MIDPLLWQAQFGASPYAFQRTPDVNPMTGQRVGMSPDPRAPLASLYPAASTYQSIQSQPASVFVTPNEPTTPTPAQVSRALPPGASPYQRAIARQMMATGASTAPVQSPLEGLARALTGLGGGYLAGRASEADEARQAALGGRLATLAGLDPEMAEGLTPEQVLGVAQVSAKAPTETWRPLTPSEATMYGVPQGEIWQISSRGKLREPGGATTTIQMPGEAREDFTTAQSKADVARYEGWVGQADTSANQLGNIRRARSLLDEGLETGRITALTAPFGEFMAGFGVDPEAYGLQDVSDVAEFTAIANRMTTDLTGQLKGALSDRELRFLEKANINVANPPEANRAIMDMLEKGAEQSILRVDAADEWIDRYGDLRAKNDNGKTFFGEWRDYLKRNETIPESISRETEEAEPETAEAGVVSEERIVVGPDTVIGEMSDVELGRVDVTKLTPEQFKTWNAEMSKRGY